MYFPLTLVDFSAQPELMRINPDASVTVLDWPRITDWAYKTPDKEMGFVIAFCRVLCAARYNFVETPVAESDIMGTMYHGDVVLNVKGENPGPGPIYGLTDDFIWQVNWKRLETIYGRITITNDTAATVGFLNLFFAGRDNFVVVEFQTSDDDKV